MRVAWYATEEIALRIRAGVPESDKAPLRLLHTFQLRDGLIVKANVWFDFDDLERQLT